MVTMHAHTLMHTMYAHTLMHTHWCIHQVYLIGRQMNQNDEVNFNGNMSSMRIQWWDGCVQWRNCLFQQFLYSIIDHSGPSHSVKISQRLVMKWPKVDAHIFFRRNKELRLERTPATTALCSVSVKNKGWLYSIQFKLKQVNVFINQQSYTYCKCINWSTGHSIWLYTMHDS